MALTVISVTSAFSTHCGMSVPDSIRTYVVNNGLSQRPNLIATAIIDCVDGVPTIRGWNFAYEGNCPCTYRTLNAPSFPIQRIPRLIDVAGLHPDGTIAEQTIQIEALTEQEPDDIDNSCFADCPPVPPAPGVFP